ncbi:MULTISPECIES: V-type ATP synthase subunit D [Aerococcus]|uniref:V-type ATP synthase subunit D n=1 Tax=Aerococcus TaxID=1375 RepID=UPI000DCE9F9B|nr:MULTISPECIES: V-type ATP synthase subunit D [Aerococcus]KAA9234370.1 V-type ATP synthase subunit D [Aerococcus mictus]MBU5610352.1 V-type ATP synthase subunit D [Aerococcus urinae]MDK6291502.1 V-type ATP synthase subunit D [Aerococcus urinae]MDK6371768.1 V-type ATP synthase subunit D [Aerococcus urinae]MDK6374540.1 V-type ATP synthase subunit D [Aerococcus urinae]
MEVNHTPTKGNLMQVEKTLRLSKNGHELMDRKRMILMNEIMSLVQKAKKVQEQLKEAYQKAYECLFEAQREIGLHTIADWAQDVPQSDSLSLKVRSVMGSEVPEVDYQAETMQPAYSFSQTTTKMDEARIAFEAVKDLEMQLAQVENAAYRLASNIQKTQKRVNALKNITIPQLQDAQRDISSALEEKEREEFTRLKVVKRILTAKDEAQKERMRSEA